ncbi:MAG: FecR family protein [Chitinophaga sp.]|uniref:FecR family protein n=1 Tax=Chitinophaga sp. TaxID=1869181 RepID=UPI001AFEAEE1|nr:FecR family protein [Chitinophaga sp.]MBO9729817.1 FecR family protein [Chitinophaga sp.]
MQELPNHIIDTLLKKLHGTSTKADDKLIADWMSNHPADQDHIHQFLDTWKQTDEWAAENTFDTTFAWSKVNDRITLNNEFANNTSNKTFRMRPLLKLIAAAAIVSFIFSGWWLFNKSRPAFNTITATADQHLTLSDGTKVWLRKGASISFPKEFTDNKRKIQLSGEAFFDVKTVADQPFLIETKKGLITVLGTSFLVNAGAKGERVAVVTGKIRFADRNDPQKSCILSAHEEALFSGETFDKKTFTGTNLQWQEEELSFGGIRLKEIVESLTIYYSTAVKIDSTQESGIGEIAITASFNKESLIQVVDELTKLTGLHYRQKQDTIILY